MILRPPRTTLTDTPFPSTRLFRSVDVSSPILMLYCSNGKHFEEATLVVRKAGGANPLKYLMIKMTKVMVTAVSTGGSGGEDRLTENITLNFAQVHLKYTAQKDDGSEGDKKEYKWDISANVQL